MQNCLWWPSDPHHPIELQLCKLPTVWITPVENFCGVVHALHQMYWIRCGSLRVPGWAAPGAGCGKPGIGGKHGFSEGDPDCPVCHGMRTDSRPGAPARLSPPTGPACAEVRVSRGGSGLRRPGTGLERRRLDWRAGKHKTAGSAAGWGRGSWATGRLQISITVLGRRNPRSSGPNPAAG